MYRIFLQSQKLDFPPSEFEPLEDGSSWIRRVWTKQISPLLCQNLIGICKPISLAKWENTKLKYILRFIEVRIIYRAVKYKSAVTKSR